MRSVARTITANIEDDHAKCKEPGGDGRLLGLILLDRHFVLIVLPKCRRSGLIVRFTLDGALFVLFVR